MFIIDNELICFIIHDISLVPMPLFISVSAQRCPNATLTISCNITTPGPVTRWVVLPGYCPSNDIILSQPLGTDCGSKNNSCGPFVATNLVPPSGMACTTSVLSVVAAPQLNRTNISCYSNGILQYQHVISITSKLQVFYLVYKCCTVYVYCGGPEGQTHGLHQSKVLEHSSTLQQEEESMKLRASICDGCCFLIVTSETLNLLHEIAFHVQPTCLLKNCLLCSVNKWH